MLKKLGVLMLLGFAFSAAIGQAGVITLDATGQGWLNTNPSVLNNGNSPDNNYIAGYCAPGDCGGDEYRNFFEFAVPGLPGSIVSARLLINSYDVLTPDPSETYQVTSIPAVFTFDDLGNGTLYATRVYTLADSNQVLAIALNGAALSAITPGVFRVGGRVTTLSGQTAASEFVFGGSGSIAGQLELTTSGVPEPATWLLAGAALALAGCLKRAKR